MESRALMLRSAFDVAHMVFTSVIDGMDNRSAADDIAGSTTPPARAIIAHALLGEDLVVHALAKGGELILVGGGFVEATRISEPTPSMTPEWVATAFDLEGLRAYASSLFAATASFLEAATGEDLDRVVETPLGTHVTAAEAMAAFGVVHLSIHAGELAALKGVVGGRGLPF